MGFGGGSDRDSLSASRRPLGDRICDANALPALTNGAPGERVARADAEAGVLDSRARAL